MCVILLLENEINFFNYNFRAKPMLRIIFVTLLFFAYKGKNFKIFIIIDPIMNQSYSNDITENLQF